jgi:bifunctional oligoribonuclease and PAP phosphatase NrnA
MSSPTHLFHRLHEAVQNADRILLVAHKKPDGDTLGSSSSFFNWCLREGKNVTAFCVDTPGSTFHYLDELHRYTNDPVVFHDAYDLVIVFDSGDLKYCGVDAHIPNIPLGYTLVNLDHHVTNTRFGDLNIVLTDASSTAEVVYRFFEENTVHIDDRMATSLLTGLCTDTSNFSNAATNTGAVRAASSLVSSGGRFTDILKHIWNNQSVEALRLWGLMLSRLQYNETYDVVSTYLLQSDMNAGTKDLVEGMSNFLNAVTGSIDTILVLTELPEGYVKGSFRSIARDVSKVAKLFGGGGHKKAAGFTVKGRIEVTSAGTQIVAA